MNRDWYDAFLKPDCLVGANTNTRKAMARNRPISENFKHRLRPCMDNADFARLIAASPQTEHTARLSTSHQMDPASASVKAQVGSTGSGGRSVTQGADAWMLTARDLLEAGYSMKEAFDAVDKPRGIGMSAFARRVLSVRPAEVVSGRTSSPRAVSRSRAQSPIVKDSSAAGSRPRSSPSRSRAQSPIVIDSSAAGSRPRRAPSRSLAQSPIVIDSSAGVSHRGSPSLRVSSDAAPSRVKRHRDSADSPLARDEIARAQETVERVVKRPRQTSAAERRSHHDGYRAIYDVLKEQMNEAARSWSREQLNAIASEIEDELETRGADMYSDMRKRFLSLRDRCIELAGRTSADRRPSTRDRAPNGKKTYNEDFKGLHDELEERANTLLEDPTRNMDALRGIADEAARILEDSAGDMYNTMRTKFKRLIKRCRDAADTRSVSSSLYSDSDPSGGSFESSAQESAEHPMMASAIELRNANRKQRENRMDEIARLVEAGTYAGPPRPPRRPRVDAARRRHNRFLVASDEE